MYINHGLKSPVEISYQYYDDSFSRRCFLTHVQNNVELLMVTEGSLEVGINERGLQVGAGDIVVFNPFDRHDGLLPEGVRQVHYYCLTFAPGFFLNALPSSAAERLNSIICGTARFSSIISHEDERGSILRELIPKIRRYYMECGISSEARRFACCYTFLCELLTQYYRNEIGAENRSFTFVRRVVGYVEAHYQEPLSRKLRYDVQRLSGTLSLRSGSRVSRS